MRKPIPQYVDEMVEGAVSRLNNLKNENTVSFAFVTDTHNCIDYTERALYAISKIDREHKIEFTCLGGDYLCNNSSTTRADAIKQHLETRKVVDELGQHPTAIVLRGNHDVNSFGKTENIIPTEEFYDVLLSSNERFYGGKGEKVCYGYYDMADIKLRAVYLDTSDNVYETDENGTVIKEVTSGYRFGNRQLNWFANDALSLPGNDWSVVVFSHIMPIATPIMPDRPFGGNALWGILTAFKNGTAYRASEDRDGDFYEVSCDFSKNGKGNVIAVITGHQHTDLFYMADGIRVITAVSAASDNFETGICHNGRVQYKTRGSGEESAFSVFVADMDKRIISMIRCGAGDDYTVDF